MADGNQTFSNCYTEVIRSRANRFTAAGGYELVFTYLQYTDSRLGGCVGGWMGTIFFTVFYVFLGR